MEEESPDALRAKGRLDTGEVEGQRGPDDVKKNRGVLPAIERAASERRASSISASTVRSRGRAMRRADSKARRTISHGASLQSVERHRSLNDRHGVLKALNQVRVVRCPHALCYFHASEQAEVAEPRQKRIGVMAGPGVAARFSTSIVSVGRCGCGPARDLDRGETKRKEGSAACLLPYPMARYRFSKSF